ncbi:hypothetical protein, partial [Limnovirga soli]|uniref:hypothetical protein n=1 Tax=Limnovirga soli TaxID=2656915 RepID=UPI001C0F3078
PSNSLRHSSNLLRHPSKLPRIAMSHKSATQVKHHLHPVAGYLIIVIAIKRKNSHCTYAMAVNKSSTTTFLAFMQW